MNMGADDLDGGKLRSIWTHNVDLTGLHDRHSSHQLASSGTTALYLAPAGASQYNAIDGSSAHSTAPGSPSKALNSGTQFQALLPNMQKLAGWQCFTKLDREVLCNALACAGASMADPLMSMVDTYYSGKLGTTALAALGSNGALFSVMYFLCFTALAVLCTQAMAAANSRGDAEGVGRGFIQALAATACVSTVLVLMLLVAPEQILAFFQTNAEIMPYAKTYLMIRALSLPAALGMNVCQAAFRSLLDLGTPFAVVMTANAANYGLDQLLMFRFGWGMAGCGWASVISQYIGAGLFAAIIYRRRHKFGIPEALACAADRYYDVQQEAVATGGTAQQIRWWTFRLSSWCHRGQQREQQLQPLKGKSSLWKDVESKERPASGSFRIIVFGSPVHKFPSPSSTATKPATGVWKTTPSKQPSGSLGINMLPPDTCTSHAHGQGSVSTVAHETSTTAPDDSVVYCCSSPTPGQQQLHHRHHNQQQQPLGMEGAPTCHVSSYTAASAGSSSTTRNAESMLAGADGQGCAEPSLHVHQQHVGDRTHASNRASASHWSGLTSLWTGMFSPRTKTGMQRRRVPQVLEPDLYQEAPVVSPNVSTRDIVNYSAVAPLILKASAAAAAAAEAGNSNSLRRLDSVGSDSKLPRPLSPKSTVHRLLLLLCTLDWRSFVHRFLGMTVRGLLILSTYSSASMVAAKAGTAMLAAHQVVQQQQQLQMSFAWSFLHVGQSMTANVYHAPAAAGGGAKAARQLAVRIITWATGSCMVLAALTYSNRYMLSGIFTRDSAVRQLVSGAALPATVMLGMAWNNALEGCLLAADDQSYVVKVYPVAVAAALLQLGHAALYGLGLPGVWWGLVLYYFVLLLGFAGRFWIYRGKV